MRLLKCILTANDCYKCKQTIKPKGVMVHSTGANNPMLRRYVQPNADTPNGSELLRLLGTNKNRNAWNRSGTNACVHGFIGKLDDGSIATVQTLPWNHRGWHAGTGTSGRSANNTHISFEICEDGLTDPAYFKMVYQEAAELTAMLCREYGLDPLADGVVICHIEGYRRGVASGHGDVEHWFPRHGKSMNDFRRDVAALMGKQTPKAPEEQTLDKADLFDPDRAGTYTVTPADGLNLRTGASTGKAVLTTLTKGSDVVCQGYYNTLNGVTWLLVGAGKLSGYVCADYLQKQRIPAVDASNDRNKEDDEMTYYERLSDVPDSYRPTIRKLMEQGALKGRSDPDPNSLEDNLLDVSEEYCRIMTTLDRMGKL